MKLVLIFFLFALFAPDVHNQHIFESRNSPIAIFRAAPIRRFSAFRRPSQDDFSEVEREGPIRERDEDSETERETSETREVEVEGPKRTPVPSANADESDGDEVEVGLPFKPIQPSFKPIGGSSFGPSLFDLFPNPSFVPPHRFIWQFSKPWWMRANVCVDNKVIEDAQRNPDKEEGALFPIHIQSKKCTEKEDSYTCTTQLITPSENKTTVTTYQCCIGYLLDEEQGVCVLDNLKSINETLRALGCGKMAELFDDETITKRVADLNLTIFAPTDESLVDFEDDTNKKMNEIPVMTNPAMREDHVSEMLSTHVVEGAYKTDVLWRLDALRTLGNASTIVYRNYRSYKIPDVETVNCVPIVKSDIRAKNAVIHVVSGVLTYPTNNLVDLLTADSRFSTFIDLMKKNNLMDMLSESSEYTIIAPTNDAFSKLDPATLEAYQNGNACVDRVLKSHLIKHAICKAAIVSSYWERSMMSEKVIFTRQDNRILINNIPVVGNEKMASNGIIYAIDDLVMPESAKTLSKVINPSMASDFLAYMNETGMSAELDRSKNYTLFIPINPFNGSGIEPEQFLNHHMMSSPFNMASIFNNKIMQTRDYSQIRFNVMDLMPSIPGNFANVFARCSLILNGPIQACEATGYIVSSPFKDPAKDVMEYIASNSKLGTFKEILANSSINQKLSAESGPFTVLAPTNEALQENLKEEELDKIRTDADEREKFVRRHILPQNLCCSIMRLSGANRASDGSVLLTRGSLDDGIQVLSQSNLVSASVTSCDNLANNGVVHIINRPLFGGKSNLSRKPIFFFS